MTSKDIMRNNKVGDDMQELKINCPCCDSSLIIKINDKFEVISIKHNEIKISENQLKDILVKNNIELG